MRLLFLANRTPYPPYRGDKLKIYHLAKRLAAKGHELHLLTFALNEEDLTYKAELEKIFTKVHLVSLPKWKSALNCLAAVWDKRPIQVLYFRSGEMKRKLSEVLAGDTFDAIHVQHIRMAPYLSQQKSLKRILDLPDAFSLYWERRNKTTKGVLMRTFQKIEQRRLLRYEPVIKEYDLTLACSKEDVGYLEKTHGATNLKLLPNGVDLDNFHPRPHDYNHNHTLLFTGNMDYAPNVDAAVYFTKEVLPLIRQSHPQIHFIIAGQRPVDTVKSLARDGVEVTGFVPNLADIYDRASVVVAPLRFGAGTQNKVLESMAMGVPVVCSEVGFAGLGVADGEGVFMRIDTESFAEQVVSLLNDAVLRETTGSKGAAAIKKRFSWDTIADMLEGYFRAL